MKLYTKTGDKGRTSVIGSRLSKDDVRVEAIGTLDEVNSYLGKAVSELDDEHFADLIADLVKIQHEIFDCGSELSNTSNEKPHQLSEEPIEYLESKIDQWTEEAPALEKFILPGGAPAAATIHIARTVTRRAERRIVTLMNQEENISHIPLQYINRLSDFLFAAARIVNSRIQVRDVEYERSAKVFHFKDKNNKE
ncbi:cob(I)alamin adenosyltransferase [Gracilibacillus halotolerans]|uniref:Corrinoid adenosyltransferase n=1 Tax=Gracilibacillus halotolerans TaxID=74386 RepID=A0A841RKK1_9BACI|nr:cob(I)yrinic acid a,c-diamide adenosyltransferase [Gracilibacillus halotolerans]MBB6512006.1 cob(I)alamin adenosyltransferase [Gracilibacillus halotolerans]